MAEIKQTTTFKASDGREFTDREEAERYEAMQEAGRQFNESARLYNIALAKTLQTADGYPFQLGNGYHVVWEHAHNDGISYEYFYARHTRVEYDGNRARIYFVGSGANHGKVVEFDLANIYNKERNAKLRLLEIFKKRLEWAQADIAKLETELGLKNQETKQ